ncbi:MULTISPECIES: asparaginase [Rhizobium/Agrobacterium group]|uniref:asparaginase n=1 Tax=Rhizobium/Agrobacterium group TaxID=227290 RepID=UPI000DD01BF6|nr:MULTISPECIES: asparaginase [Rhizobium/Agrobacterium group]MBO9107837.1 asparaginase [Agrobacterium sp. S2/73]NTA15066.1 asparaginase [Agrobacterium tumefaciens]NTA79997.1 asparaginase [Agrobacterium tumefaciens]QXZ71558.1 asparaginase [Agrobacterium sp. S7/73]TWC89802.1 asparaginase [Rhizobium sp. SJZ105]
MNNSVTVEVLRGSLVESRHQGLAVVVDGDGGVVFSAGDVERGVFPRSACKAMQALPLVESGAADAYGFGNRELALACSSHSGEDEHAALAASMLARAGRDVDTLECGAHWSSDQKTIIHQARTLEKPTALHNNCSGKHSGFICACCHTGTDPEGYVGYDHPLQREIRATMESLTGATLGHDNCGVDGCSIPTYAVPLKGLAHGFAKMATGRGLEAGRAQASRRLFDACMAEPFYVAGTGRTCTRLMQIAPGRIFAKTGAEGVFVAALPEKGIAMAVKCEDGTTRAAEAMIAAMLAKYFDGAENEALLAMANRQMRNWNGIHVGDIRVVGL